MTRIIDGHSAAAFCPSIPTATRVRTRARPWKASTLLV